MEPDTNQPFLLQEALTNMQIPIVDDWIQEAIEKKRSIDKKEHIPIFVTEAVARHVWKKWNEEQQDRVEDKNFRRSFQRFLARGVELGYRLDRFESVSGRLPAPDGGCLNWIPFFEEALAQADGGVIRFFLSSEIYKNIIRNEEREEGKQSWEEMIKMMNDGLFYELGIFYPGIQVLEDEKLDAISYRCEWNDWELPPEKGIEPGQVLVNDTAESLKVLNIEGKYAVNPANGKECAIVDEAYADICEQAGLTTWDQRGYLVLALSKLIRSAAGALIDRDFAGYYLYKIEQAFPEHVAELNKKVDLDFFVQVLRCLLEEEISIRSSHEILGAILKLQSTPETALSKYIVFSESSGGVLTTAKKFTDLAPADYAEFVRQDLKKYISHKYTKGRNTLVVYLLDRDIEILLEDRKKAGLGLLPSEQYELEEAVYAEVGNLPPYSDSPVILTHAEVRSFLRRQTSIRFPELAVLSYQELSPDMNIQPIARISADEPIKLVDSSYYVLLDNIMEYLGPLERAVSKALKEAPPLDDPFVHWFLERKEAIKEAFIQKMRSLFFYQKPGYGAELKTENESFSKILFEAISGMVQIDDGAILESFFEILQPVWQLDGADPNNFFQALLSFVSVIREQMTASTDAFIKDLSSIELDQQLEQLDRKVQDVTHSLMQTLIH